MANMEFHKPNYINTTTMIAVDSNTDGVQFLFDKNISVAYSSNGYTGATVTNITITLTNTTSGVVISSMMIQNHNLQNFLVFYSLTTSNTLLNTTTNSASSTYLLFASTTMSAITLRVNGVFTGTERSIGEIILSDRQVQFERNPSIQNFDVRLDRKQVVHEMPDGGVVAYNIRNKYRSSLSWDFVTSSFKDSLQSVYEAGQPVYFIPEPTATAWNGIGNECLWVGDFDFNYSSNVKGVGYSGKINLRQTPSR